jgi:hypothetical protein
VKVIISGSRSISDQSIVEEAISESKFAISEVFCGCAKGVDSCGRVYANKNGIPVKDFEPNFSKFGNSAPIMRNVVMALHADALIAVWDGKSIRTRQMIDEAHHRGLKVYVKHVKAEKGKDVVNKD